MAPISANRRMLGKLAVITVAMFAFGYRFVPLYKAICEMTGINILALGEQVLSGQKTGLQIHKSTEAEPSRWSLMRTHVAHGNSSRPNGP